MSISVGCLTSLLRDTQHPLPRGLAHEFVDALQSKVRDAGHDGTSVEQVLNEVGAGRWEVDCLVRHTHLLELQALLNTGIVDLDDAAPTCITAIHLAGESNAVPAMMIQELDELVITFRGDRNAWLDLWQIVSSELRRAIVAHFAVQSRGH